MVMEIRPQMPVHTEKEVLLALNGVSFQDGGRRILDNVGLFLHAAEIMTLIGPNGAGKTTLLRLALGFLKPSSGTVHMKKGLTVGYMPQRLHIDPTFPLTVKGFLSLVPGKPKEKIEPILEELEIAHLYQFPMQTLSGGETQRVLLAHALIRKPELLILDEPVQGVDVHGQMALYQLISRVRDRTGCAILMVSHDLHFVMAATDQVVCLNCHVCCRGTPEIVARDPSYAKLFGPAAANQVALYIHDPLHQHDQCTSCGKEDRHG